MTRAGQMDTGGSSVDPYLLERWYTCLAPGGHTAATTFLPLDKATAVAMLKGCEERRGKGVCDEHQKALLEQLRIAMDAHMSEACFVKLAARSCKDSILRSSHFKRVLQECVGEVESGLDELQRANELLRAYVRAQCFAMRRQTAEEALHDMLESRRVYEDLTLATLEPHFRMDIVFRKWNERLVPEREIRCFVVDRKVTAMTQYYSSVFVPALASQKESICRAVLDYLHGIIIPLVPMPNCTIDVGMTSDGNLCVVELNPPAPRSGTSLFTWNHGSGGGKDNDILTGVAPFEFRVLEAPLPLQTLLSDRSATFEHLHKLGYQVPTLPTQTSKEEQHDSDDDERKCILQ